VTIEWVWMVAAATERREALALPGGFTAAQSRQIEQLEKLVAMVRDDKPDLEGERLYQEGDMTGYAKHLRARLKESGDHDKGGDNRPSRAAARSVCG
jgi:hypothetical protein